MVLTIVLWTCQSDKIEHVFEFISILHAAITTDLLVNWLIG